MIEQKNKILEPKIYIIALIDSSKNIYNLLVDNMCIFIAGKGYDVKFCAMNKLIESAKKIDLFI